MACSFFYCRMYFVGNFNYGECKTWRGIGRVGVLRARGGVCRHGSRCRGRASVWCSSSWCQVWRRVLLRQPSSPRSRRSRSRPHQQVSSARTTSMVWGASQLSASSRLPRTQRRNHPCVVLARRSFKMGMRGATQSPNVCLREVPAPESHIAEHQLECEVVDDIARPCRWRRQAHASE